MTLPTTLRFMGWLLAVIAAGSAVMGVITVTSTITHAGGPDGSLGILLLFMSGALQSLWQTVAGAAMALLCFAVARLLERGCCSGLHSRTSPPTQSPPRQGRAGSF